MLNVCSLAVTNLRMCALLNCTMKLDCNFRLVNYYLVDRDKAGLVLIWWPMISEIAFESGISIRF